MQIHEKKLNSVIGYPFELQYSLDDILFFDIETTGLSSKMSYLYLIGCVHYKKGEPYLLQWFADSIEDEKELLIQFFTFLENYKVLIHYNGSGFDIPYLTAKCKRYQLRYNFEHIKSIDIYKELHPMKKFLPLESLKQRSVEEYLGIKREDTFTGGDLISVYGRYVGIKRYETLNSSSEKIYAVQNESGLPSLGTSSSDALLYVLLLHNAEDLQGLLCISSMLAYRDFFQGQITNLNYEYTKYGLSIFFELKTAIPKNLNFKKTLDTFIPSMNSESFDYVITCSIKDKNGTMFLPFYEGVLKHFFANYKDYYYLPMEDTAIHKSVAEYVEKDYRKKATKETCYIKKEGIFLPQTENIFKPEFLFEHKDKIYWFEYTCLSDASNLLNNYAKVILSLIFSK